MVKKVLNQVTKDSVNHMLSSVWNQCGVFLRSKSMSITELSINVIHNNDVE